MSAVSSGAPVRVGVAGSPVLCTVRWRVSASAVTAADARAWLAGMDVADGGLVSEVRADARGAHGNGVCEFSLEASGCRLRVCDAACSITQDAGLTHIDAFDAGGTRLLAATLNADHVLYAVTTLWERLGVAGGRYEVAR
jgi:hypothetical protein